MIPFILSVALIAVQQTQSAEGTRFTQLSENLSETVTAYEMETGARLRGTPLPETFALEDDLQEFANAAMGLSLMFERENGPEDLRCIFRGMAQDAIDQANRLSGVTSGEELRNILSELNYLFEHATAMGPVADQDQWEAFTGVPPDCPRGPL